MTDFYLISIELGPKRRYAPRECRVLRRVRSPMRDDLALVEVRPPIPKESYRELIEHDLAEIVLGAYFEGQSLFPVTRWPTYVYIFMHKFAAGRVPEDLNGNYSTLDWGAIFRTRDDAIAALQLGP